MIVFFSTFKSYSSEVFLSKRYFKMTLLIHKDVHGTSLNHSK